MLERPRTEVCRWQDGREKAIGCNRHWLLTANGPGESFPGTSTSLFHLHRLQTYVLPKLNFFNCLDAFAVALFEKVCCFLPMEMWE